MKIKYNPYILQMGILVDGKELPEYSQLIQFINEDIWKWHKEILEVLYSELKEDFFVEFIGTKFDIEIFKYECENFCHCIGFESSFFSINYSMQKRMGMLNQLVKRHMDLAYKRTILNVTFILEDKMKEYKELLTELDINNLFCNTKIQVIDTGMDVINKDTFLFILSENAQEGKRIASRYSCENPIFIIYKGKNSFLNEVDDICVVYENNYKDIVEIVFKCFLGYILRIPFYNCIVSLSKEKRLKNEINKICAIHPMAHIKIDKEVEIGKSNSINIVFDSPEKILPQIIFKVIDTSIATTDNLCVFGHKEGMTQLECYYYGSKEPFAKFDINVVLRNRIKNIILDEDRLVIGCGDIKKIYFEYFPKEADNINKIKWKTSDETIATVNSEGNIYGKSTGICKIICTAENVSAICECEVRPYLESINIELPEKCNNGVLLLEPMEEHELIIKVIPYNAIDNQIFISSSDSSIVNVIGNKLIAKNSGEAVVTVSNSTKRKKINLKVHVSSHSFFSKFFNR